MRSQSSPFTPAQQRRFEARVKAEKYLLLVQAGPHAGKAKAKVPNGVGPDGRQVRKEFGPTYDIEYLIAQRDKTLAASKEGRTVTKGKRSPMTVGQWLNRWLDEIVAIDNKRSTWTGYRIGIANLAPLHGVALEDLSRSQIITWRAEAIKAGKGAPTVNYALTRLKTALAVAVDMSKETGLLKNPAAGIKRVRSVTKEHVPGDPQDILKLVASLEDSYMAALPLLAVDLGLRRGELCGLRWGDLDLDAGEAIIRSHVVTSGRKKHDDRQTLIDQGSKSSQGKVSEPLSMSPESVALLRICQQRLLAHKVARGKRWQAGTTGRGGYVIPQHPLDASALVFPSADGDVREPGALAAWFHDQCARAGVADRGLHSLRHDCASYAIDAGKTLTEVQKHMRHANPAITASIYAHAFARKNRDRSMGAAMSGIWRAAQEQEATALAV